MADPKKNPLIGAFRAPVPGAPPGTPAPPEAGKPPAAEAAKPLDEKKGPEVTKAPTDAPAKPTAGKKEPETLKRSTDTPAKPTDEKKGPENPKAPVDAPTKPTDGKKEPEVSKVPADTPAKPASEKNGPEAPKAPVDTSAKPAGDKKEPEVPKPTTDDPVKPTAEKKESSEPPKVPKEEPAKPKEAKKAPEEKGADKKEPDKGPELRFVAISKIKPLPGTYVKDEPRKDYSGLIADIKKNGLQKPIILRKSEKEGEFQLVDGFHRCKALEQAGMLEVRADVYEMTLAQASEYRRGHRDKPLMPVPGKLVLYPPEEPAKADKTPKAPAVEDEELPENLKISLIKEGQPETVTTMKVANIRPFEGHPFAVRDNKDMWDLVDSIKKFGVLEPVMVIPHKDGGYEMVSGHRRMRACQLAGIEDIPVIVRNLDRDEAIISMVDSNLKREEISPMEKARAYQKYLYLLNPPPKRRPRNRAAFSMREELLKLERYQEQFRYLRQNRLETANQLSMQYDAIQAKMDALTERRKELYQRKRRGDGEVQTEIVQITTQLRALRRDLKLCARIEGDIPKVRAAVEARNPASRGRPLYHQTAPRRSNPTEEQPNL